MNKEKEAVVAKFAYTAADAEVISKLVEEDRPQ